MHIAQPHEQPQQQHSRRPLSVGVAAALAMRAPLCCVRPPTEFGVILGRFDKIPFTAVLRRKSPRFSNLHQLLGKQEGLPLESRHSRIGAPETSSCPFPATIRRPSNPYSPPTTTPSSNQPYKKKKYNVGFAAWPKGPTRVAI